MKLSGTIQAAAPAQQRHLPIAQGCEQRQEVSLQQTPHKTSKLFASFAGLAVVCLLGLGVAGKLWSKTWDDAAITLGYSRTLALNGELRFGKYGEFVEGFTSPLWMFVGSILAHLNNLPEQILENAKLLNACLYLTNVTLTTFVAQRMGIRGRLRFIPGGLLALSAIAIVSIPDAMENHAFLTLHLLALWFWVEFRETGNLVAGTALGGLLAATVWCRPEGALTLVAFGLGGIATVRCSPREIRLSRAFWVATTTMSIGVLALLWWRFEQFHSLLPNTLYAKRWLPYSATGGMRVVGTSEQIFHFFLATSAPLLPFSWRLARDARLRRTITQEVARVLKDQSPIALCLFLHLAFYFVTGKVWGPKNRTVMAEMVFIWLVVALVFQRLRLTERVTRAYWWQAGRGVVYFLIVQGIYIAHYARSEITVQWCWERTAPAVLLATSEAGDSPWRIAAPDVGAALLWWGQDVEFIDTALLNERESARHGWAALSGTLFSNGHAPDILLTHSIWTKLAGFDSDYVRKHYVKVRSTAPTHFYCREQE